MTKQAVKKWLLGYAWVGTAEEQQQEVECILAQGGWQNISAVADKFAGAQEEPGPEAFEEGVKVALSALYECHTAPHTPDCPHAKGW